MAKLQTIVKPFDIVLTKPREFESVGGVDDVHVELEVQTGPVGARELDHRKLEGILNLFGVLVEYHS